MSSNLPDPTDIQDKVSAIPPSARRGLPAAIMGTRYGKISGRVRRAVRDGFARSGTTVRRDARAAGGARAEVFAGESRAGVQMPLPREQGLRVEVDAYAAGPPMMSQQVFRAGRLKVLGRIAVYVLAVIRWYTSRLHDKLRRRDSDERRAIRLRETIEKLGGTAVKIGQQMAMRIDLMPYIYGQELSKMLDRVPPFPSEYAVKRIEKLLGAPLASVFSAFDPEPVGSASVACVYQGVLKNGERVAVKVRRPGIGEVFVADCTALDWVFRVLEYLTVLHPGLSHNFRHEFRTMLVEELDFVKEARNAELFRRRVKKKLRYASAPRVYFDLSGDDVLTTEYVTGVWLGEMIAAVEQDDGRALAYLESQKIDPKVVAKRLIRTNLFGIFENVLFHADPHPSNVLVQPNNKLVFIDFGSCGAYTTRERTNWRQLVYYQSKEDVGRMAQTALAIIEPIPPIDIDDFTKRLETVFWRDLYAFKSKHSQWWERTSARVWISFLTLTREYNIPMNLNTLRMIRSTLLYETVAARIHKRIDSYHEHRQYLEKQAGKRARKRVRNAIHKRLFEGLTNTDYLRIEQLQEMGNRIIYLTQRHLDAPPYRFSLLIKKSVYVITVAYRAAIFLIWSSLTLIFGLIGYNLLFNDSFSLAQVSVVEAARQALFTDSALSRTYWLVVTLIVYLHIRKAMFRLWDKEVQRDNTSGLS